ncbi:TPA: hypothetical protein N3D26_004678 [Salmonella enterica subsp. enterica serovar Bredeney]|uniref:Uncharacterized protein n=3 Tax=Salmonella enterica TaxID=28901 RepID=A0A5I3ES47_SALET|nr:hypothetical protein [Salmonella enterica]EAA2100249.1 hypothetical protein [Salmonella enterica subsp. enterica serovar Bredeney]EAA7354142.1 hypothetical protein [Salmonella enterica subsp. enterica]EAB7892613.1 hypothetical protein [Salmonella enterica subsp. enterica serovar Newport]EBW5413652.1 hypothetical protein [Salmonella enterica subsp. enterica serovar Bonn]EBY7415600.1 hypothetical protein [Salmonella enterica subsp. enterica serovar Alachua]ECM6271206.1 hypothetical protein [
MNNIGFRYFYPYGQYGECFTRGPWLPSTVESAFDAQVARDSLNLHNEVFKIENIISGSLPVLNKNIDYNSVNYHESVGHYSYGGHSSSENTSDDAHKINIFSCLISCFNTKDADD